MEHMNLLVTVDANYIRHVKTLLVSLRLNGGMAQYTIYIAHTDIADSVMNNLVAYASRLQMTIIPLHLNEDDFAEAPVTAYYSKAMYYRLLASKILPRSLDTALYLDPDILVINPLCDLYNMKLGKYLFAAAAHTGFTDLSTQINRIRLDTPGSKGYFNSGVMLLNLKEQNDRINAQEIYAYVRENAQGLLLPDQDVLNALYSDAILPLDDSIYNYDARRYGTYLLTSGGVKNLSWVMEHTALIHFCGKNKPWDRGASGKFVPLYKHYAVMAKRYEYAELCPNTPKGE